MCLFARIGMVTCREILSVFLSFCLSVFLSFCLSVFLSFCLSVFLSTVVFSQGITDSTRSEIAVSVDDSNEVSTDFSEIPFGEKIQCRLTIVNRTSRDLKIDKAVAGCGCMKPRVVEGSAKIGESLTLELDIQPRDAGNYRQSIVLKPKDDNLDILVAVTGTARRRLEIEPVNRTVLEDSEGFKIEVKTYFGCNLTGAEIIPDLQSEFNLKLVEIESKFFLMGTAKGRVADWPVSGFSESVIFKASGGEMLSAILTVRRSVAEMLIPSVLDINRKNLRVSLVSPRASDPAFGRRVRIVNNSGDAVVAGKESRRSASVIVFDLSLESTFLANTNDSEFDFQVDGPDAAWNLVGKVKFVIDR